MVTLKSFELHRFSLKTGEGKREGLIWHFKSHDGKESYSEVSPLPNYSKESLEEAEKQILFLKGKLLSFFFDKANFLNQLDKWCASLPFLLYPSVRFALDAGIYSLLALPFHQPNITRFFSGNEEEILEKADKLKENPPKWIKIKLGRFPLKQALLIMDRMIALFPYSRFRIDFNRKWSLNDAIAFCKNFPPGFFDYIEEPAPHFELFETFFRATGHLTALDETLRELPFEKIPQSPGIAAVILRPTLQGGITALSKIIKHSLQKNWFCTLTSSYETQIGLRCIELFSNALHLSRPLGIDTLDFFKEPLKLVQ